MACYRFQIWAFKKFNLWNPTKTTLPRTRICSSEKAYLILIIDIWASLLVNALYVYHICQSLLHFSVIDQATIPLPYVNWILFQYQSRIDLFICSCNPSSFHCFTLYICIYYIVVRCLYIFSAILYSHLHVHFFLYRWECIRKKNFRRSAFVKLFYSVKISVSL